jgi:alkylhydroperoxidase/carboxymuconolactone decarboxylase family protein YurZ
MEGRAAGLDASPALLAYARQFGVDPAEVPGLLAEAFGERFAEAALRAAEGSWDPDGLGLRERSLVVIASLVTQGAVDERLRGHVRLARAHGLTAEELEAAVTLLAAYAGFPRASVAMEVVRDELRRAQER